MPDGQLVWRFPMPESRLVDNAYWDIDRSENGTETEKLLIGDHDRLPKPWDVATCNEPDLRRDVWDWYDRVVTWFNHEYVWDPAAGMVPPCWPLHPHLVHDIGVLADQRRRKEWHRYAIPALFDRLQKRAKQHCAEHHQPWPARTRFAHHLATDQTMRRVDAFRGDVDSVSRAEAKPGQRRLMLVDDNGDIIDPGTDQVR